MKRSLLALTGIVLFGLSLAAPVATAGGRTPTAAEVADLVAKEKASHVPNTTEAALESLREKNLQLLQTRRSPPTHCRYDVIKNRPKVWWIHAVTPADFVNLTTQAAHDYEIIYSNITPTPGTPITIETGDQIVVADSGGKVTLAHYDKTGVAKPNSPGSPDLVSGAGGLWVEGDAHAPSGTVVGKYYLYKLDDRAVCKHRNSTGGPCRQVHFEFFLNSLTAWRPVFGTTVFPITDKKCIEGDLETDDGDGDEGLR